MEGASLSKGVGPPAAGRPLGVNLRRKNPLLSGCDSAGGQSKRLQEPRCSSSPLPQVWRQGGNLYGLLWKSIEPKSV